MNPPNARILRGSRGFSLIEVILAIGLVTFAMLVIFSLMPAGMATLQEANRQIVETEIFSMFDGELSATPFDKLASYQTSRFPAYFDNEGNEVTVAGTPIYIVRCDLAAPELGNGELCRASILIGYRRDPAEAGSVRPAKRTFLLVDRGI